MDPLSQAAVIHEVSMDVGGALVVNAVWWVLVMVIGIAFPYMHFVLAFLLITGLGMMDQRQFPGDVSTTIYAWRALTNLCLFILGLILIGPLGVLFTTSVPTGPVAFIMATISIVSVLAIVRCTIITMILITRMTTKSTDPSRPNSGRSP